MTVSADPQRLRRFPAEGHRLGTALEPLDHRLTDGWVAYRVRCPRMGPSGPDPGTPLRRLRTGAARLDAWVAEVGTWFQAADEGTTGSLSAARIATVMAPLTVVRPQWPAPVVVGWNPLTAPRRGTFDAAGYGQACTPDHTASVSILGPDGLGYPVVVPGAAGSGQESPDWMPTLAHDPSMGSIDDTGRTWTTVRYSEALVPGRQSVAYRIAGTIAATAGWVPVAGPSLSASDIGRVLRIEPNGRPHLVPTTVTQPRSANPATPEEVTPAPRTHPGRMATSAMDLADLALLGIGGWRAAANEGSGFVQAQYQQDQQGHRRVLVRGYEVRVVDATLEISAAYWNGRSWSPLGESTLHPAARLTGA